MNLLWLLHQGPNFCWATFGTVSTKCMVTLVSEGLRNQRIFFWRKHHIFLELERPDGLSAVPNYNWRNVPELSWANNDVICVITSAIEDNYIQCLFLAYWICFPGVPDLIGSKLCIIAYQHVNCRDAYVHQQNIANCTQGHRFAN